MPSPANFETSKYLKCADFWADLQILISMDIPFFFYFSAIFILLVGLMLEAYTLYIALLARVKVVPM